MPSGSLIRRSKISWSSEKNPSSGKPSFKLDLSSTRMTTLSPWLVGIVETRRSIGFFLIFTWMRPSSGKSFSAMLLQDVRGFVGRAIIFDQRLTDFLRAGANQFQRALEQETKTIDRIDVEWIAYRHNQPGFTKSDWNHFKTARFLASDLIEIGRASCR